MKKNWNKNIQKRLFLTILVISIILVTQKLSLDEKTLPIGRKDNLISINPKQAAAHCPDWHCAQNVCGDSGSECDGTQRMDPEYCWWEECDGGGGGNPSCAVTYSLNPPEPETLNTSITVTFPSINTSNPGCVALFRDQENQGLYCTQDSTAPNGFKCIIDSGSPGQHTLQLKYGQSSMYPPGTNCGAAVDCNSITYNVQAPSPPSPTVSGLPSCMVSGPSIPGMTISWGPSTPEVNYIDLSTDNFTTFYNKGVAGVDQTDSSGFNGASGVSGPLTYTPGTTYQIQTFNGYLHSANTFTAPGACAAPTNITLKVSNVAPAGGFSGIPASGRQNTAAEEGKGWFNPMKITVNATAGSGTMKNTYVAFYDKAGVPGGAALSPLITDVTDAMPNPTLQNYLKSNPANGFLLAYNVSPPLYFVWDPNQGVTGNWVDITGKNIQGWKINYSSGCNTSTHLCYTVYPGNTPNTWNVLFDQGFDSKGLYTGVQAVNSNNQTTTNPNIAPTQ